MSDKENNIEEQTAEVVGEEETVTAENVGGNLNDLFKQIKELQEQVEKHKENYVRSVADFDNYRRRMIREIDEMRKSAAFSLIEDLLPILDNLMLGVEAAKKGEDLMGTVKGFEMVLDQFKAILSENGVQEINPEGGAFDHNEHECVSMMASAEVAENNVIAVVRLGYRLSGRLLRPASVVVSSGPAV
jgi:molecular chaperone GrpE